MTVGPAAQRVPAAHDAGFEAREVAVMLGRPEGTIKADLHHPRSRLKAALTDTAE
jgi:DNA-directed RNA polymerase specialized sigma24 family protein